MNTPKSIAVGWGALCIAAGGAYMYARQEIDSRRLEQARTGRKDTRILTWEERIALDQMNEQPQPSGAGVQMRASGGTVGAATAEAFKDRYPTPETEVGKRPSRIQ